MERSILWQFFVEGMVCVNCQNRIEKRLRSEAGIQNVLVDYASGRASVRYDPAKITQEEITTIIKELGYGVRTEQERRWGERQKVVSQIVLIVALFLFLERLGILNFLAPGRLADSRMSYGMLFVVGLISSVHCIGMCGGINLSQCIPSNHSGGKMFSALLYNLGRVVSYTAVGFVLGAVGMLFGGAIFGVSNRFSGILKLVAGAVMIVMGLRMLNLFPQFRRISFYLPNSIAKRIHREKIQRTQPFFVGLLNGLMPCGPLQAIQLVALASASPVRGAISMLVFSLGTVPLMLGFGSLVAWLGRRFTRPVMQVGAMLVVVLGMAMVSQGGNLLSAGNLANMQENVAFQKVSEKPDVQEIQSTLSFWRYPDITVQAGVPVRWVIDVPRGALTGCNYRMFIPAYGIAHSFTEGENVIEFTPDQPGTFSYSCWMGMMRGTITVTDGV